MHPADRQQHMARVQGAGSTRTSGRRFNAFVIQQEQQGFSLNALKAEIHIPGQPALRIPVQRRMRNRAQALDQPVPFPCRLYRVLFYLSHGFFQGRRHRRDPRHVFRPGAFSVLLRSPFDQVRKPDPFTRKQEADALRPVELMGGSGQQINLLLRDINREMADRLNSIRVEKDPVLPADLPDLPDRLNGPDLVVGVHDRHQAGIFPERGFHLFRAHDTVLMNIQEGNLKAFLFQLLQGMQDRVMLKGGGNNMLLSRFPPKLRRGTDRLVIRLAAPGGKQNLPGLRPDHFRHGRPGFLQRFLCLLTNAVQAGRVPIVPLNHRNHRIQSRLTHLRRSGVVRINQSIHSFRLGHFRL